MNAKVIQSGDVTVFVVKEKRDYGIKPFEVNLLFISHGELNTISDHFKSKEEQHDHFKNIDERFVKRALEDWREFYD